MQRSCSRFDFAAPVEILDLQSGDATAASLSVGELTAVETPQQVATRFPSRKKVGRVAEVDHLHNMVRKLGMLSFHILLRNWVLQYARSFFGHDDTSIRAINHDVVWEHRSGTPIKTAPAVSGNKLFVHDYAGNPVVLCRLQVTEQQIELCAADSNSTSCSAESRTVRRRPHRRRYLVPSFGRRRCGGRRGAGSFRTPGQSL